MKELNVLIKQQRERVGKTLEEVGKAVGVSKTTVQRWESGLIKDMRRDKLVALARALDTTPAYLMGWEAPSPDLERTQREQQMVELFNAMPTETQDALLALARQFLQRQENQ